MGKIQLFEEHKLRRYTWVGPKYYDYPDGEDLAGKLYYTCSRAGILGMFSGIVASNIGPILQQPLQVRLFVTARHFLPCIGAAVAFTTATFFSTRLRNKDDEINYVIGGLASGPILGLVTSSFAVGIWGTVGFAGFGYYKKYTKMEGIQILPTIQKKSFPNYIRRVFSKSFIEDKKGNWTAEP